MESAPADGIRSHTWNQCPYIRFIHKPGSDRIVGPTPLLHIRAQSAMMLFKKHAVNAARDPYPANNLHCPQDHRFKVVSKRRVRTATLHREPGWWERASKPVPNMVSELRTESEVRFAGFLQATTGSPVTETGCRLKARTCRDPLREEWINRGGTTWLAPVPESEDSEAGVFDRCARHAGQKQSPALRHDDRRRIP